MTDKRTYSILAMAGVTPFVACALLPLLGISAIEPLGPLDTVVASYGLAIVSFLTGIHWATQLYERREAPFNLLLVSNVVFLFVWLAFIVGTTGFAIGTQLVALLVLLGIDGWLLGGGVIEAHYYRVRKAATLLAVVSLAVILVT